ncbi:MAG TPA: hypothetical protein DEQ80_09545 [Anaerolinea thermolimosa]|uniref:Uncharacterized protein n=1 Tax=Anaerolinea thermolimosa TaxID=229919 RepID=A0A3D1JHN7_9CHLR|nr:hypothetical protein [Anaerolinea thermolimosa]GAP07065.1 hypothetical protein ATHL_01932 [Anaerolinea thermolimosa]HCE18090.1 hypothetical protein [Anaerolinea thermolimosa]
MERYSYSFRAIHVAIILAAMVTTVIHFFLGLRFGDVLFLLNALGYVGLTGLFLIPLKFLVPFREWIRWILIAYSALTIVLWAIINGTLDAPGITAKSAEFLLIILLWVERKKS